MHAQTALLTELARGAVAGRPPSMCDPAAVGAPPPSRGVVIAPAQPADLAAAGPDPPQTMPNGRISTATPQVRPAGEWPEASAKTGQARGAFPSFEEPTGGSMPGVPSAQDRLMMSMLQTQHALLRMPLPAVPHQGQEAIQYIVSEGGDDSGGDAGLRPPGAKGASAREAFRQEVWKRPLGIAQATHRHAPGAMDWEPFPQARGSAKATMRNCLTQEVALGSYRMGLDGRRSRGFQGAHPGVVGPHPLCERAGHRGQWKLDASSSLLVSASASMHIHQSVGRSGAGGPFTELADAKWCAALMGYLKDLEAPRSQRRPAAVALDDGPPPKKGAKGQGRGGEGAAAGQPAAAGRGSSWVRCHRGREERSAAPWAA